jgi:hypothetical protein
MMSNEYKDWLAELPNESKEDLIDMVKHFQSVAMGEKSADVEYERYILGKAVDKFTEAAQCVHDGGTIRVLNGYTLKFDLEVPLSDFILGWGSKYSLGNIRFEKEVSDVDGETTGSQ